MRLVYLGSLLNVRYIFMSHSTGRKGLLVYDCSVLVCKRVYTFLRNCHRRRRAVHVNAELAALVVRWNGLGRSAVHPESLSAHLACHVRVLFTWMHTRRTCAHVHCEHGVHVCYKT